MAVSSGKWYYEVTLTTLPASMDPLVGFTEINNVSAVSQYPGQGSTSYSIYHISSNTFLQKVNAGAFTNTNTTVAAQGDILGVALDLGSGRIWFSKNGTWVDGGNPSLGTNAQFTGISGTFAPAVRGTGGGTATTITANFGQRPWAYDAPFGFLPLCTTSLPQPIVQKSSTAMDVVTYTGTGVSRSITGLGFSPDLVWLKIRQSGSHALFDSARGATKLLSPNATNVENTWADELTAFNSDGFSLGVSTNTFTNANGNTYVGWAWNESPISGVDIVSYVGDGNSGRAISHGLGVAPKFILVKNRTTVSDWPVYHSSLPANNIVFLHLPQGQAAISSLAWGGVSSASSSTFTVTAGSTDIRNVNKTGDNYIAYCFAEVEGFSKFGSYTGNGSADGPFIYCGFRPKWVLFKAASYSGANTNWITFDTSRDPHNVMSNYILPNSSGAEAPVAYGDSLSNGFKFRY
jgi:hypothetical protein